MSVASLIIEDRGSLSSSEGLEWIEYRELGGPTSSLGRSQLGRLDLSRSQLRGLGLGRSQLKRLALRPWLEPAVKLSKLRLLCLELRWDSQLLRSLLRPCTGSTTTEGSEGLRPLSSCL